MFLFVPVADKEKLEVDFPVQGQQSECLIISPLSITKAMNRESG